MRLLCVMALLISCQSFASEYVQRKFQVDFHGDNSGRKIYYRCESAKKLLEDRLASVGAQAVETICTGGLESYGRIPHWQPLTLVAKFEVPTTTKETEVVELNAENDHHEDCFLNVTVVEELIRKLPEVKVLKKKNSCLNNYTKWSYTIEVPK